MIVEKVVGKLTNTDKKVVTVSIDWFERDKKLLRKTASNGNEIGIKVDTPLDEGDILYEDDEKVIVVEIAPCDLIKINVKTMREMGRVCFELGNRHLSLAISDDFVKCPYDEPTYLYMKKLGFDTEKIHEKFTDYIVCKAHSHTHGVDSHHHDESHHEHHHEHHHDE